MPHFVREPPPANYSFPEMNLSLPIDVTGRATINVWCPARKFEDLQITLKSGENYRLSVHNNMYNKTPTKDLFYFEIDGLRSGDLIAVTDKLGTGQLTDWLPVQGVLPSLASPIKNVVIEPMGGEYQ